VLTKQEATAAEAPAEGHANEPLPDNDQIVSVQTHATHRASTATACTSDSRCPTLGWANKPVGRVGFGVYFCVI
jgi:hypothetical protein